MKANDEQTSTTVTVNEGKGIHGNKFFLFEKLISFLEQEAPLNLVLAGYFRSVVCNIVQKQEKEIF